MGSEQGPVLLRLGNKRLSDGKGGKRTAKRLLFAKFEMRLISSYTLRVLNRKKPPATEIKHPSWTMLNMYLG